MNSVVRQLAVARDHTQIEMIMELERQIEYLRDLCRHRERIPIMADSAKTGRKKCVACDKEFDATRARRRGK